MGNDNDDTDMQPQASYFGFSSYFMTDEEYVTTFICMCFVKPFVLLLNIFFLFFKVFQEHEDLLNWVQCVRKEHKFVVVIQKSGASKKHVTLDCKKGKRSTNSTKTS